MNIKQTPRNNILTKLITNKKPPTQQNRSICFQTKITITDIDKAKAFNKQFTTSLHIVQNQQPHRSYTQDPSDQENMTYHYTSATSDLKQYKQQLHWT